MKRNVGLGDAIIRWALAAGFFVLAAVFNSSPLIALVSALLALIMAGTALTGVCPLYSGLGINTARREPAPHSNEGPAR